MSALTFTELSSDERLALVGLLRIVIQADKRYGLQESANLQRVAELVGRKQFNQAVDEARQRVPTLEAIKVHAATITRPAARELIYRTALEMAQADEVVASEEQQVLSWLAQLWQIPAAP